jgi:hypothetical protein
MDEEGSSVLLKDDVRAAGKPSATDPEPETSPVEEGADELFRSGIPSPYVGHEGRPLGF